MLYNLSFLKSALTLDNPFISIEGVKNWLLDRNEAVKVFVDFIPFNRMDKWVLDKNSGNLRHDSGRFFTIEGINVNTNWGKISDWDQPIINQPEIGYLGIISKEIDGVLYFLLQAKIEPGNVNYVQLSPTLQATKSNYTQVHNGKKPLYLEYFQNANFNQILLDQLQSEQGARFLRKRNRNIIIKVNEPIKIHEDFVWLTLGQIKYLMKFSNLINMDTRTVISGIPFGDFDIKTLEFFYSISFGKEKLSTFEFEMLKSALNSTFSLYSFDEILNWLSALKCRYEINVSTKSLYAVKGWIVKSDEIAHEDDKFFKVVAAKVEISNREVSQWTQPIIQPMQDGLIVFVVKRINGIFHFLVQGKVEPGNFDIVEMAPTVQCLTGSYKNSEDLPFLDYVVSVQKSNIKYDSLQSEEGGRFFREQNRNMIIEADENFPLEVPENFKWVSLQQLTVFLKFNNYLNIQARSLISSIRFI